PGYDTLRLLLCDRAILVEGDSDELIIQRAYLDRYEKLPIHDKVDVISVGTSFERFAKIAEHQGKEIIVVTDNDGDPDRLNQKYKSYVENEEFRFKACYDSTVETGDLEIGNQGKKFNYNTLEPKLLKVNTLELFNEIFGTEFDDINRMHIYMYNNKTDCALAIFNSSKSIEYPEYIKEAIKPLSEDE
ncbi:MAG: TOPRIM nucleotidyl transferase/hydrolase domain-containing protein, partial [Candidatus Paceibacterota bacterium]